MTVECATAFREPTVFIEALLKESPGVIRDGDSFKL
jgi:hypothetical protein